MVVLTKFISSFKVVSLKYIRLFYYQDSAGGQVTGTKSSLKVIIILALSGATSCGVQTLPGATSCGVLANKLQPELSASRAFAVHFAVGILLINSTLTQDDLTTPTVTGVTPTQQQGQESSTSATPVNQYVTGSTTTVTNNYASPTTTDSTSSAVNNHLSCLLLIFSVMYYFI